MTRPQFSQRANVFGSTCQKGCKNGRSPLPTLPLSTFSSSTIIEHTLSLSLPPSLGRPFTPSLSFNLSSPSPPASIKFSPLFRFPLSLFLVTPDRQVPLFLHNPLPPALQVFSLRLLHSPVFDAPYASHCSLLNAVLMHPHVRNLKFLQRSSQDDYNWLITPNTTLLM